MRLQNYLRVDFANKMRHLFIKNECECCNSKDNLELHHVTPFSTLLDETLSDLNIDYVLDTDNISTKELELIKNIMRGKQLEVGYLTMCKDCHRNIHKEEMSINTSNYKAVEIRKQKEQVLESARIHQEVIPYLESMTGVRIYGRNQTKVFSEKIGFKTDRNKIVNSYNFLNKKFKEIGLPYLITSHRTSSRKDNRGTYWMLNKIEQ